MSLHQLGFAENTQHKNLYQFLLVVETCRV